MTFSVKAVQDKMEEWQENGVRLGWLFRPDTEEVFIYRLHQIREHRQGYGQTLTGEAVLPNFTGCSSSR